MSVEASALDALVRFEPGSRIRQYRFLQELGRGGMGIVYVAHDTKLDRRVAIKFLHSTNRDIADRFLVEARATARCHHENIVVIHEVDEHEGVPYMVLELLEGASLREHMREPVEPARVVGLMLPVARALARAHELGFVHRDLKPENVFVTRSGQVKVLDFGIAKALDDVPRGPTRPAFAAAALPTEPLPLTAEGAILGTLPYMSPEQMTSAEVDHRSDLWSFGIILFELLAGRHPITPPTNERFFENLIGDEPMPSIRDACEGLPDALVELVTSCLARARHARLASAAELVRRLEAVRIEPRPTVAVASKPRRRRAVVAAVLAAATATLAVVALWGASSPASAPPVPPAFAPPAPPVAPPKQEAAPPAPVVVPEAPAPPASAPAPHDEPKKSTPHRRPPPKPPAPRPAPPKKPCDIYGDRIGC